MEISSLPGRKIGEALEYYYNLYQAIKLEAKLKMFMFMFVKGNSHGDNAKMIEYGGKLKKLGKKDKNLKKTIINFSA